MAAFKHKLYMREILACETVNVCSDGFYRLDRQRQKRSRKALSVFHHSLVSCMSACSIGLLSNGLDLHINAIPVNLGLAKI